MALMLCGFVENGLGHFPVLFGSVPKLTLVTLFILCFYQTQTVSAISVVAVGLLYDLIQANPLGYTSGLMLVVHGWVIFRKQLLAQAESGSIWYEFTILMAVTAVLVLFVILLYYGRAPAIQPLIFQFSLTVLLFPVINWIYLVIMGFASMLEQLR